MRVEGAVGGRRGGAASHYGTGVCAGIGWWGEVIEVIDVIMEPIEDPCMLPVICFCDAANFIRFCFCR